MFGCNGPSSPACRPARVPSGRIMARRNATRRGNLRTGRNMRQAWSVALSDIANELSEHALHQQHTNAPMHTGREENIPAGALGLCQAPGLPDEAGCAGRPLCPDPPTVQGHQLQLPVACPSLPGAVDERPPLSRDPSGPKQSVAGSSRPRPETVARTTGPVAQTATVAWLVLSLWGIGVQPPEGSTMKEATNSLAKGCKVPGAEGVFWRCSREGNEHYRGKQLPSTCYHLWLRAAVLRRRPLRWR